MIHFTDYLTEDIIDENIPKDLLLAYKDVERNVTSYNITNPNLSDEDKEGRSHAHIFMFDTYGRQAKRRHANFDYGKCTYTEMTAEDAINYVKENKGNIANLRIIYNNSLVIYDLNSSNVPYVFYGDSTTTAYLTNPTTHEEKSYKNIRYAPWRLVLQNAQKIYKTDEYEHPLYKGDKKAERDYNKTMRYSASYPDKNLPGYNEHAPYDNFIRNTDKIIKYAQTEPDTGAHDIMDRYFDSYNPENSDIMRYGPDRANDYFVIKYQQYYRPLVTAIKEKDQAYNSYKFVRGAIKKLNSNKSLYRDKEFANKLATLKQNQEDSYKNYIERVKEFTLIKDKYVKFIDEKTFEYNKKITLYYRQIQNALAEGYKLKMQLEQCKGSIMTSSDFSNDWTSELNYNYRSANKDVIDEIKYLENLKEYVVKITTSSDFDSEAERQSSLQRTDRDLKDANDELQNKMKLLDTIEKSFLSEHLKRLKTIEEKTEVIKAKLSELRPHVTADKAKRQAKNKAAQLDASLTDIIAFTDFHE